MMNIKKSFRIIALIFFVALSLELLVLQFLLQDTKINGEVYRNITAQKDLVADVIPPPAYLLEAHFVATAAFAALKPGMSGKGKEADRLIRESPRLQAALEERQKFYATTSYVSDESKVLIASSSKLAVEYFNALNNDFIPAIVSGDTGAADIAYTKLVGIFDTQVDIISKIVQAANRSVLLAEQKSEAVNTQAWVQSSVATLIVLGLVMSFIVYVFKNSVVPLRHIASELAYGAQESLLAANQVALASQRLAEGASEQAAAVHETSASLDEISSMIHATSNNASKAKVLANESQHAVRSGLENINAMTVAMDAIEQSGNQVAKIAKAIDEIAFQTNILALNAAVEAARAGEAGAGFAVVADEVRSLAQRSAAAAHESADKIETSIKNSRDGAQVLIRVKESFFNIDKKVHDTDLLVSEIALAAKEQAQGIEHIGTALQQLGQVTQSNASNAEVSASAAEEMNVQSGVNRELTVKLFGLVDGSAGVENLAKTGYGNSHPPRNAASIKKPTMQARTNLRQNGSRQLSSSAHAETDSHFQEF